MHKAYKFRLYPNAEQRELIEKTFGCCRFVYNHALNTRQEHYAATGETLSGFDCIKLLPKLKEEFEWLKEVDSSALIASVEDMDTAYKNFFRGCKGGRRVGFPKFKSKKSAKATYRAKQHISVRDNAVRLPKLGWVHCHVSTAVAGRILSATVTKTRSGKYFVSLCCTDVVIDPLPPTGKSVGVDLGVRHLATTSDGEKIENHKYLIESEKRLATLQRRLSRKSRGSKRYEKARVQVARLHEHIANQRLDAIHKLTTALVREYDTICVEDLNVSEMAKSRFFAKRIYDASWGELVRQLEYKCGWYGKTLVKVDAEYPSSKRCSVCGYENEKVANLNVRKWVCPECGTTHDRDINAAINILEEGLRLLAA